MNIVKFGKLMATLGAIYRIVPNNDDMHQISSIIEEIIEAEKPRDVPPAEPPRCDGKLLEQLMFEMQQGLRKIDAIRLHRQLTGYDLKESKDIVEKYWRPGAEFPPKARLDNQSE